MNRWIAWVIGFLSIQNGFAQKTEFIIGVSANASFFRRKSAASTTAIYISDVPDGVPNVTADYYGKKTSLGTGAEVAIQYLNKKGFVTGVAAGYEVLSSRVKINQVSSRIITPASGSSKITHTFVNLFPYVGQRFGGTKCALDFNLGLDIGLPLSAHERGKAEISNGTVFTTDTDHSKPSVDLRPRLQLKLKKNRFGVQSSYSIGQVNYYGRLVGADPKAYSNVFRLGVFYTL